MQENLAETEIARNKVERACAHCGLPVFEHTEAEDTEEPAFCCSGCRIVYEALAECGLDDTYYALRSLENDSSGKATIPEQNNLQQAQWDLPAFLERNTILHPDGTRSGTFLLEGVHCAGCVWVVEQMPFILPGVQNARLNLLKGIVSLTWDPALTKLSALVLWLRKFGYKLVTKEHKKALTDSSERRLLKQVGVSWALAGNIMLLATTSYGGLDPIEHPGLWRGAQWVSFFIGHDRAIIRRFGIY